MHGDDSDAMKVAFKLDAVRRQGKELLEGRELYDFQSIREQHDQQRTDEDQLYRKEYTMRTNVAYQMLLRRAGSVQPALKPRFMGTNRFNTKQLQAKAHEVVHANHLKTMARIDRSELSQSTSFLERCSARKAYLNSFNQSSERRQSKEQYRGIERRQTPSPTTSD